MESKIEELVRSVTTLEQKIAALEQANDEMLKLCRTLAESGMKTMLSNELNTLAVGELMESNPVAFERFKERQDAFVAHMQSKKAQTPANTESVNTEGAQQDGEYQKTP